MGKLNVKVAKPILRTFHSKLKIFLRILMTLSCNYSLIRLFCVKYFK